MEHGVCAEYPQLSDLWEFSKQMHDCGDTYIFPNMYYSDLLLRRVSKIDKFVQTNSNIGFQFLMVIISVFDLHL